MFVHMYWNFFRIPRNKVNWVKEIGTYEGFIDLSNNSECKCECECFVFPHFCLLLIWVSKYFEYIRKSPMWYQALSFNLLFEKLSFYLKKKGSDIDPYFSPAFWNGICQVMLKIVKLQILAEFFFFYFTKYKGMS